MVKQFIVFGFVSGPDVSVYTGLSPDSLVVAAVSRTPLRDPFAACGSLSPELPT